MASRKKVIKLVVLAFAAMNCAIASAIDGGSYTGFAPYTVFGIGDLYSAGSAYNATMGGVGIATRNNRYINTMNPAAVTARDSLAFMSDFSMYGQNKLFRQGDLKSANNTFNLCDFVISFPLWKTSAMMVGVRPFSSTGYSYGYYETNEKVIYNVGNAAHAYSGEGGLYQVFASAGITFAKRLSIGAEYEFYFGDITKKYTQTIEDNAALALSQLYDMALTAHSAKFGLQYEQPVGNKLRLGFGATYRLSANLLGYNEYSKSLGSIATEIRSDTLTVNPGGPRIAGELGVGISFTYMDKLRGEIDYIRTDWTNCGFEYAPGFAVNGADAPVFRGAVSQKVRLGVEYLPNISDIRYYHKKIAYRAGAYFGTENYTVFGQPISTFGITFGATLPVFRWYNGVTIGMELGQRGTLENDLVKENYIGISVGFNLFDIWFRKNQYE